MRRGRWWSVVRVAEPPLLAGGSVEDAAVNATDLRRAVARLSDEERLVLYLYFSEDLPLEQAATVMGVSTAAARSRLYRGLKRLRPGLELREGIR